VRSNDWDTFTSYDIAATRSPEFVVQVIYDDETVSFTSHSGIANLVGTTVDGVISGISSSTQKFFPLDGRAQIGGMTIKLIDEGITSKVRAQLAVVESPYDAGESLRHKEVRVWKGYTGDFDDFVQVATTYINSASIHNGEYVLSCVDVTRQLRKDVFEKKITRLAANLSDPDTSPQSDITVTDVDGFAMLTHTASFSDSPNATVGYLKVKDTGEIIRYTGISESPAAFTGITREVFGTVGGDVPVDTAESESEWPEIEEFIYLEMPAVQIGYAVITGKVLGSSPEITLPDHWHMGIDVSKVATSDWESIGTGLYDGDTGGVVLKFGHLKKTDGKKFVEQEIHRLIGTYSPIKYDGTMGLGRVNQVLSGASYVASLTEDDIVKASALKHKHSDIYNQYRIDYGWDGKRFTDSLLLTDADSITRNNTVGDKVLKFQGLHTSAHSQSLIYSLVNALQNRYRNAPQELNISVLPRWDVLEPGDVVHVSLDHIPDFAGDGSLSRAFEIQSTRVDWISGRVDLTLFASSGSASDPLITPPAPVLADAFYTSKGTDLATISPSIVSGSGHITSDCTLTGNADMNDAGAIYYYDGDLTIDFGVTVTITDNVQLRVKGTLTVTGKITGVGQGKAAEYNGSSGYVGSVSATGIIQINGTNLLLNESAVVNGQNSSFPSLTISAGDQTASPVPTDLGGIPTDLRGAGGCAGGYISNNGSVVEWGGDGGDGGAGLCIIARQVVFGVSGEIDLSGTDGTAPTNTYVKTKGNDYTFQAGTGSGGGSGSLLILNDGSGDLPSTENHYISETGAEVTTGLHGNLYKYGWQEYWHQYYGLGNYGSTSYPLLGKPANPKYSNTDNAEISRLVMYIPESA